MKSKITILLLLASVICFGQKITVKKLQKAGGLDMALYNPLVSPNGSKLLLTAGKNSGLYLYDIKTQNTTQITSKTGAGHQPQFNENGTQIIFRSDDYSQKMRQSSINVYDLKTQKTKVIVENKRGISPAVVASNEFVFTENGEINVYGFKSLQKKRSEKTSEPVIFNTNAKITLVTNGMTKTIAPLGEVDYIWPSLSPDKSMILFTVPGKGTFVADLDGNIISELGYANAPRWSGNGKWIVYMVDEDDGHRITSSDIYVCKPDGSAKQKLTEGLNAMYPCWSKTNDKIVFNTIEGDIYIAEVE